jgi:hypothetical protein
MNISFPAPTVSAARSSLALLRCALGRVRQFHICATGGDNGSEHGVLKGGRLAQLLGIIAGYNFTSDRSA